MEVQKTLNYIKKHYPELEKVNLTGNLIYVELEKYEKAGIMLSVADDPGKAAILTRRGLVLAAGKNAREEGNLKAGQVVQLSNHVFEVLYPIALNDGTSKSPVMVPNPNCALYSFKPSYKVGVEPDKTECMLISYFDVIAELDVEDYIFANN